MTQAIANRTNRLFCPGPTPVPLDASIQSLHTDIYHRSSEFKSIFSDVRKRLAPFFDSKVAPIILTSSGTGALEAAVVNLTEIGDEVLVINGGKFGERWHKLTAAYQCKVREIKITWGHSPDVEVIVETLRKHPGIKALFIQANETSTGVAYPIKDIAEQVRKLRPDLLLIVDAVSALIAHHVKLDSWGLDCVISGSQKGFGVAPGLAFIALSERAWLSAKNNRRPKFYFDLSTELKTQLDGQSAWTPATTLVLSLRAALDKLEALGVDGCEAHHKMMAEATRAAMHALGLELFSQSHHSQALTAAKLPERIDGNALISHARQRYGAIFAGGQDQAKGKIVRLAHLGIFDHFYLLQAIQALEFSLLDIGHTAEPGVGVTAAIKLIRASVD
jgi:aspartate aminotransferase-like enzyme